MSRIRIAIVGAGMGGLASAALLTDRGHDVTLFDQFAAPRPVGSGLVIQPVGLDVLDEIGAGAAARAGGARVTRMLGLEVEGGRRVLDVSYGPGDAAGLAIHRARLFQVLHDAVLARNLPLQTGHRAVSASAGHLTFADGRKAGPFDLVVDASGATSSLSPIRTRPLPYGAVWGTVDWPDSSDLPKDRLAQRYRRADRMIGVLPVGTLPGDPVPKAAIFWSLPAGGHAAWRAGGLDAWKREAQTLWPDASPFFDQITEPEQMTMARYGHGTLIRPWDEVARIAFVGDAAHRASPQLGQGANMALLDAAALARALERHSGRTHLPDALRAYGMARRWHVWIYQAMSAAFTPQYQSDSRALPVIRDRLLFPLSMTPPLPRVLTALVSGRLLPPLGGLR